jgi:hypothetical protein
LDCHKEPVLLSARVFHSVKGDWQNQVLAASRYRELGMFNDAAQALDIEPEEGTRKEVLGARVDLYMAAKKWDMAAAVAGRASGLSTIRCASLASVQARSI